MRRKTDINFKESEKSFRNFIKNLRRRTADKMTKNKMMTELSQKKIKQNRNELYTISYKI